MKLTNLHFPETHRSLDGIRPVQFVATENGDAVVYDPASGHYLHGEKNNGALYVRGATEDKSEAMLWLTS